MPSETAPKAEGSAALAVDNPILVEAVKSTLLTE